MDSLGLFFGFTGHIYENKPVKINSVAISGRLFHIMTGLIWVLRVIYPFYWRTNGHIKRHKIAIFADF